MEITIPKTLAKIIGMTAITGKVDFEAEAGVAIEVEAEVDIKIIDREATEKVKRTNSSPREVIAPTITTATIDKRQNTKGVPTIIIIIMVRIGTKAEITTTTTTITVATGEIIITISIRIGIIFLRDKNLIIRLQLKFTIKLNH
jgi:hypothetical protein